MVIKFGFFGKKLCEQVVQLANYVLCIMQLLYSNVEISLSTFNLFWERARSSKQEKLLDAQVNKQRLSAQARLFCWNLIIIFNWVTNIYNWL